MTDLERYVIEEHVEDFNDRLISRRELLRRVTLITGSTAATLAVLSLLGCGAQPAGTGASPAPSASLTAAYATPPPSATTDGITVKSTDSRLKSAQRIEVKANDGAMLIGYLARPNRNDRASAVLVVHENRGLVEHIKDVVRRVATAGFVGLSVDLLSRQGGAERLSDPNAYIAELAKHQFPEMVPDLRAALDYLRAQSFVARDRLGVTGFCFGGGMVWNLLADGADVKAAVPFYGPAPQNLAALATAKAAVLGIYAEQDTRITGTAPTVEAQLKKDGHPTEIKVYPGVNHAFHNDTNTPRYAPAQAQQAWVQTIEWLRKYLG